MASPHGSDSTPSRCTTPTCYDPGRIPIRPATHDEVVIVRFAARLAPFARLALTGSRLHRTRS